MGHFDCGSDLTFSSIICVLTLHRTTHLPTGHRCRRQLIQQSIRLLYVVYVGTIADHHAEWARKSILTGKTTVVGKPMMLSYAETKELVDLAKEKKVSLM